MRMGQGRGRGWLHGAEKVLREERRRAWDEAAECLKCQKRFTTYERVENIPLIVVKKGGQRTPFDKNKIFNGMIKACEKRPVPIDAIKEVVDDLERSLYQSEMKEVPSSLIGEQVMTALKTLDQVAYVRFASVYRQFKDVASFMDELERLISEKQTEGNS